MRNYITNLMFMLNGPDPIEVKTRSIFGAVEAIERSTKSGVFASDCLITWAKSLGFLEDKAFVDAVNRRLTGDVAADNVIKGVIWRLHGVCWAAHQSLAARGDFVEAGCYAGDTARIVADYVGFGQLKRTYWLYDLFETDSQVSHAMPQHSASLYDQTVAKFADVPNARIVKGKVPDSFDRGEPEKIAFLHIDLNNAPSERAVLERLYDRVAPGGVILFDDYGWVQYRAQKDSADQFMAAKGRKILELPTGQGLAIR